MIKSKSKAKHLVGYRYNDDQLPKEKIVQRTKPEWAKKSLLYSDDISPRQKIGYIEIKVITRLNKQPIVKFISSHRKKKYSYDFNPKHACLYNKKPNNKILDTDIKPWIRYYILEIPYNEWRKSTNHIETLYKYHPRQMFKRLLT